MKNEILDKENLKRNNQFVPLWKNLKTWISQRCWEIEYNTQPKQEIDPNKEYQYKIPNFHGEMISKYATIAQMYRDKSYYESQGKSIEFPKNFVE